MAQVENAESKKLIPILSRLRPPPGAVREAKRKGRGPGSGNGKTAGKGQKGQKARQTGMMGKLGFEGGQTPLQRRLPKVGFTNIFAKKVATVNLRDLERFSAGAVVDEKTLRESKLVRGKFDVLKVLGKGEITKGLTVRAHAFSASAKEQIEKRGGKVDVVPMKFATATPAAAKRGSKKNAK